MENQPQPSNDKFLNALIGVALLALLWLTFGCATTRPRPTDAPALSVQDSTAQEPDSTWLRGLYAAKHYGETKGVHVAQLPAYLVPPPAGSTPAQVRKWQRAQRIAMVNASKPAEVNVKNKNVGNSHVKEDLTIKQRDKLKQYDRSKQKNDQRDQTQKKADLSSKEVTKTGFTIPAGFWIVLCIVVLVWLVLGYLRGKV